MKKYYKPLDYMSLAKVRARQGRAQDAVRALFSAATHPAAVETLALIERSQKHALKTQASSKQRLKAEEEFQEDDLDINLEAGDDPDDGGDVDLNIDVDTDDDVVPEEVDSKARAAFARLLKGMKR